jgi:L-ribulokinase
MSEKLYVTGVDYRTYPVRCIIPDTQNGEEIASSVFNYSRWK